MYNRSQDEISRGLSPFMRFTLGSVSAIFAIIIFVAASAYDKAMFFYGFGLFCIMISIACFTSGQIRQFVCSLIGCILFITAIGYLISQLGEGSKLIGKRSEPSLKNAIAFLFIFGLPGLGYAVFTRFGFKK